MAGYDNDRDRLDSGEHKESRAPSGYDDLSETAELAEKLIRTVSPEVQDIARNCAILHWFDKDVLSAAAMSQGVPVDITVEEISRLPFVERLPFGLAYHGKTRKALLKKYAKERSSEFSSFASVVARAYERRTDQSIAFAERLYCLFIAGDEEAATKVRDAALKSAAQRQDWQFFASILDLQGEAESLAFVKPAEVTAHVWIARGVVAKLRKDLDGAINAFNAALELSSDQPAALINRGLTFRMQGKPDKALSDLTAAIDLKPDEPAAFCGRGLVWKDKKDSERALDDFGRCLQLKADYLPALINRGLLFRSLADPEKAINDLIAATLIAPQNPDVSYNLALAYYDLGQLTEARNSLDKTIKLAPSPDAYNIRAAIYRWLDLPRRAVQDAQRALSFAPDDVTAKMNLAGAMVEGGQTPKGLQIIRELLDSLDESETYGLAALNAVAGKRSVAIELLKQCADLDVRWLQSDPDFRGLHSEPEFQAIADLGSSGAWRPRSSTKR
ncbi:tetratricopeptide repeat protein [Paraburkholderia terrae]|uniref:Tetratricopeptide repeat protein n=1 Tax=Paraburkholderia terrae TaxID=311230 RepID=A0A2I8EZ81_9BURK|nr:tetratricopeptide repeat protein [Paraburkholderia terrae]AUT64933.1 tetratricopeptide repeat protein [Paraburkholderia terrae]